MSGAGHGAGAGAPADPQDADSAGGQAPKPVVKKKKRGIGSKLKGLFGFGKKKKKDRGSSSGDSSRGSAFDPDAKYLAPLPEQATGTLERAMRHLNSCGALGLQGLYRVSGDVSTVGVLAQYLTTGQFPPGPWQSAAQEPEPLALFHAHDIARAVARVLKQHEPLCTYALSSKFMQASGTPPPAARNTRARADWAASSVRDWCQPHK